MTTQDLSQYERAQQAVSQNVKLTQVRQQFFHAQQKKFLTQSAAAVAATIGLVVVFLFVIFPLMIRFAGNIGNLTAFQKNDTIPPRVPAYPAPPVATQEQALTIQGFAEADSSVVAVNNGVEVSRLKVGADGNFSQSINLNTGKNLISFYSVDSAGNESPLGKQYPVNFDKDPPELSWESPEDQQVFRSLRDTQIKVAGVVNEQVELTLNERLVPVDSDGKFSTSFALDQPGKYNLKLVAKDPAGNQSELERVVEFKP